MFSSLLPITGQFSARTGTLLYVVGSRERHSELTQEKHVTLGPIPKEDSSSLTFLSTGPRTEIGRPKYRGGHSAEITSSRKC